MIQTKEDLYRYLESDRKALGIKRNHPFPFKDEIWKYEIILRKREYYTNVPGICHRFLRAWYAFRHHRLGVKLGFMIPINVCDEGLQINHSGLLIISMNAKIGKHLNVHQGVNIGVNIDPEKAPHIGDNVFIGPDTVIYGDVHIADNIAIAAGSVVTKSFIQPDITIGGVPAKVINEHRGNPFA